MVNLSSCTIKVAIALTIASLLSLVWGQSFTGQYWVIESSEAESGWRGELPFTDYPSELELERLDDSLSGLLHYRGDIYVLEAVVSGATASGQLSSPRGTVGVGLWYSGEPPLLMLSIVDIDAAGETQYKLSQTFVFSDSQESLGTTESRAEAFQAVAEQLHDDDFTVRQQAADQLFDALPGSLMVLLTKAWDDDWRAREGVARVFAWLPELTWVNRHLLRDENAAVRRVVLEAFQLLEPELLIPYLNDLAVSLHHDDAELRALAFKVFVWNTAYLEFPEPGASYSQELLKRLEFALPGLLASFDEANRFDQQIFLDMVIFLGPLIQDIMPLLTRLRDDPQHPQHSYAVSLLAYLED